MKCSWVALKKVEILIISPYTDLDSVKRSIAKEQPAHFSLRGTNVLRFRDYTLPQGGQRNIDVDLTVSTASLSLDQIQAVDGFPLAPYSYILLRKLEDWDEYQGSPSETSSANLANDIITMLKQFDVQRHTLPGGPFDPELWDASVERVVRFYAMHPKLKPDWRRLGFTQFTPLPVGTGTNPRVRADTPKALPTQQPGPAAPPRDVAAASSSTPRTAAEKPRKRKPLVSRTQIRNMAAKATVSTLQDLGIPCALFGSMGCRMFGNSRPPNVSFQVI